MENKLESVPWLNLNDKKIFEYSKNQLGIQHIGNALYILVRRKNDDGKILSKYFTMKNFINDIDATNMIKPALINLENDSLNICYPVNNSIKFSVFKNDFTVNQFSSSKNDSTFGGILLGSGVLYLEVPKAMQIIKNSDSFIEYIN